MTEAENERLTRVGLGTPCGEMMRRYWIPVGLSEELTDLPKLIKVLGEELLLFRDTNGRVGLLGKHCPHRGVSLEYGRVEERGIRCCYHGWLFDTQGHCLDQPLEPPDSNFKKTIRHEAHPCQELGGLIFAYLGPAEKIPLLPSYSFLARDDGTRSVKFRTGEGNYLQRSENHADTMHTSILHEHQFGMDFYEIPDCTFTPTEYGMTTVAERVGHEPGTIVRRTNHFMVPMLQTTGSMRREHGVECAQRAAWKVPIDDTHTRTFELFFIPFGKDGKPTETTFGSGVVNRGSVDRRATRSYEESQRDPGDEEAQMSQGPIQDRTKEHLGSSDRGVIMWRNILKKAIDAVERGEDPPGIIRDPVKNNLICVDAKDELIQVN